MATVVTQSEPPAAPSGWRDVFADAPAVLFSVKTYAAAVTAYTIALSVGMEHPNWAITTAFITSQPLAGGVVGKAVYRLAGTVLSAGVAILLVPNLVDAPELLALALALWLGLCSFLAALNRSPSSYTFLMSGYTVSIIAYPVLTAPQTVFTVASFRVQEIGIGILCAAFFHAAILPQTITARLAKRVRETVANAEHWTIEALSSARHEPAPAERRRIALDLDELRTLSASLPFDTARLMPRVSTVRALRDQLMQLLPLGTAIEDRRHALGVLPPPVAVLIDETCGWLAIPGDPATDGARAEALVARAAALEPALATALAWRDVLLLSLLARLGELIGIHHNCRLLAKQVRAPDQVFRSAAVPLIDRSRWRSMHVDVAGAAQTAAGAVLTVLLGCVFWIATAWDSGANAVLFAGVVAALFGSQDNPKPAIFVFLFGIVLGSLVGLGFAFAVLPRTTDLVLQMLVLAPPFLIAGVGMATPATAQRSLGFVIGLITASGLDLRYDSDFASVANGTLALVLGVLFASLTIGLTARVDARAAVFRVIRAGWRDLAQRSDRRTRSDIPGWMARMSDRIGLLMPRLAALSTDPGQPLLDALTDMRVGVTVGQLRDLRIDAPAQDAVVSPVLAGVVAHYRDLDPRAPRLPPTSLLATIDIAMVDLRGDDAAVRRRGLLALAGLRRTLYPQAAAPVTMAAA